MSWDTLGLSVKRVVGTDVPRAFTSTARSRGPSAFRAILRRVPSYYRDPNAPAPNQSLRVGAMALMERDGMLLVERRAKLRFVSRSDLELLDLTPAHRPIVECYLAGPERVVVE